MFNIISNREIQAETMRDHYIPTRMAKSKMTNSTKCWWDVEQPEF